MSIKHPIISVTGSSGAGTSTVKHTFQQIFRRESVKAATIEGDAFHRYNRREMKKEVEKRNAAGDATFSHFSFDANLLPELEECFRSYSKKGTCRYRHYVHNAEDEQLHGVKAGSLVVIRFKDPHGIDFPYLVSMIHDSWMSRANSIVIPGGKLDLAMQLILTPLVGRLVNQSKRVL